MSNCEYTDECNCARCQYKLKCPRSRREEAEACFFCCNFGSDNEKLDPDYDCNCKDCVCPQCDNIDHCPRHPYCKWEKRNCMYWASSMLVLEFRLKAPNPTGYSKCPVTKCDRFWTREC